MGKRKLHGKAYYCCDWTGYPMAAPNAYMPVFKGGKMAKKGSYCNFESVVAHAQEMVKNGEMSQLDAYAVKQHVLEVTGGVALPHSEQLHFTDLQHFGGDLDIYAYSAKCVMLHPMTGVKVSPNGEVFEVLINPEVDESEEARAIEMHTGVQRMQYPMEKYLTTPYMLARDEGHPRAFLSTDVQKRPKLKQRDAVFFYHLQPNGLPHNHTASKIMKRDIYGDLLILVKTREPSLFEEPRYTHFTKQMYEHVFEKKKRAPPPIKPTAGMGTDEWEKLQGEMQTSVTDFEAAISKGAQQPGKLAKGAVMPPATGKELVVAAQMHGFERPFRSTDEPSRR